MRAVDNSNGNVYISNSIPVDPDKWNGDRGAAFSTAYNSANHYSFVHNTPSEGGNYYRLQQIDKDGKSAYSKAIFVHQTGDAKIVIAPNPAHNRIVVSMPQGKRFTSLTLYDEMGKKVMQKSISSSAAPSGLVVQDLAKGMYRLVPQGDSQQSVLFIKD